MPYVDLSCFLMIIYFVMLRACFFMFFIFFFKQKTAYEMRISDWSSDVCSSDLQGDEAEQHDEGARRLHATPTPLRSEGERAQRRAQPACGQQRRKGAESAGGHGERAGRHRAAWVARSAERSVGKECVST